jgi:hypothetical protein
MCTGRRFFGRASIAEIFDLVTKRHPGEEIEDVRGYFPELVPILAKLLQRDPDLRYQDGLTLARDLRAIRHKLGPAGDLLQFNRLLRAGRIDPGDRDGSLAVLPALPPDAEDWEALVAVASGEEVPMAPWDDDVAASKKVAAVIGPDEGSPVASPESVTEADVKSPRPASSASVSASVELDEPPAHSGARSGQIETVPLPKKATNKKVPLAPAVDPKASPASSTRAFGDALDEEGPSTPLWKHPLLWLVLFGLLAVALLAVFGLGETPL